MPWERDERRDGDRWTRSDGNAVVVVRETATGEWAVTVDRLEQAPEGSAYERATVPTREAALDRAAAWRRDHDTE